MATKIRGQQWVQNAFASTGGWDILHPGVRGFFQELGYFHGDVDRVFENAKAASMYPKAWATTAMEVEKKAQYADNRGGDMQPMISMHELLFYMDVPTTAFTLTILEE